MVRSARPQRTREFDPEADGIALAAIARALRQLAGPGPIPRRELDAVLRRHPRDGRGFFSRSQLIAGVRHLGRSGALAGAEVAKLVHRLQLRPVRTRSGVTPVTVLTKPFPCPGRCIFCPDDVRMPKSYLSDEPGAQRAAAHDFDPYRQAWSRLAAYRAIGHSTDKIELIVLGGTWSAYPEAYRVWFVERCLAALNDFGAGVEGHARAGGRGERASWRTLEEAQHRNRNARARCVGLSLETRPDHLDEEEVVRLRRLGATKVQVGLQSLDDRVLRAVRRGHDVETSRRALSLLRSAGFKIHAHWMPNLLGATPESDIRDFARLFDDVALRPDELKIYPCSLIESAPLTHWWRRGDWRPYAHAELMEVLVACLPRVPRWCRVTRVIRDISSHDIVVGNKRTNFRELAEAEVLRRGGRLCEVRHREVRDACVELGALRLRSSAYTSSVGEERFLEWVTPADQLAGFLRLTLPRQAGCVEELVGAALIREVHVYGEALELGSRPGRAAQHRGLGRSLVEAALTEASAEGYRSAAVISAVGTRAWYASQGFGEGALYQHRRLRGAPSPSGSDL